MWKNEIPLSERKNISWIELLCCFCNQEIFVKKNIVLRKLQKITLTEKNTSNRLFSNFLVNVTFTKFLPRVTFPWFLHTFITSDVGQGKLDWFKLLTYTLYSLEIGMRNFLRVRMNPTQNSGIPGINFI